MVRLRALNAFSHKSNGAYAPFARGPRVVGLGRLCLFAAALAGAAILSGFAFFAVKTTHMAAPDAPRTEAIVAMTGGSSRISDAVALLGAGNGRRLLISGVNPTVQNRELARVVPAVAALRDCCIDLDHRAQNTLGNAIETGRWARAHGFRSLLVVTSNYHMPRTLMELERVLPGVKLVAYPVNSSAIKADGWWKDWPSLKILGFEYVKYLLAAARLRLDEPTSSAHAAHAS